MQCDEIDLFRACIAWAKQCCKKDKCDDKNADDLKNALGNCFRLIRFGAMDGKQMNEILSNQLYNNSFTREELTDVIQKKFDPSFQSQIFQSLPRSKALSESTKLICKQQYENAATGIYTIKSRESTWFSTNEPILLTSISFCAIRIGYPSAFYPYGDIFHMEVLEYNTNIITAQTRSEVLNKSELRYCDINTLYNIQSPGSIYINPHKIYEIRLNTQNLYRHHHLFKWQTGINIKVNDKISVKFHEDPLNKESSIHGMASELAFYPI